ncbi:MAG: response regulator [Bacilli bacterium]|nr:response regulator [Bacilli bacterium]
MKSIKFLEDNNVNIKASLGVFGNKDIYNDKLGEYLVGVHTKIKQLIVFMQRGDIKNYLSYVTSLANDALIYGFTKLHDVAVLHQKKAEQGDIGYISMHINDLIKECNNTISLIQEYMNGVEEKTILKLEEKAAQAGDNLVYTTNTILVVDDSNIVRNFVKKIFSNEYNVGEAKDGNETIKILEANKDNHYIKAMLLDLNMPKIDGFGVLEYMKNHDYLDKIPVSIISGDSSKETIKRAFTYNIVDMLGKPFNNQSVRIVVEKTLMMNNNQ